MIRIDYVDEFISALQRSIPKRSDLVREVARVLRIETEPASRRLNRQVNFSINEMLALAKEFKISLDSLTGKRRDLLWFPFVLDLPWQYDSLDALVDYIDANLKGLNKVCSTPFECIAVYFSLPMEFFVFYPELMKFFFFKWGHFFVDPEKFNDYASWDIPQKLLDFKDQMECLHKGKTIYIWDDSLIFSLVREVRHLHLVGVIDEAGKGLIRDELHTLLHDMEKYLRNPNEDSSRRFGNEFYISSIQIGTNAHYIKSEEYLSASFSTHFTHTENFSDYEVCASIRDFALSIRSVSTLISGSGYKERSLFFKDQHEIVDFQLG